jgi:pimeloyl-ACP methyl ester carboxylesterase
VTELAQFGAAFPLLALGRRGDGHAVLTIPGFLADDASMWPLRRLLELRGYRAEGWGLGRNLGPTQAVLDGMSALLEGLHLQSGRRVSVIGSSLGSVYSRELARRHPDLVRLVVTLGSPFQLDGREDNRRRAYTADMYQAMAGTHDV